MFRKVLKEANDPITVLELCAGHGRNIYNIIEFLKPSRLIVIDHNK